MPGWIPTPSSVCCRPNGRAGSPSRRPVPTSRSGHGRAPEARGLGSCLLPISADPDCAQRQFAGTGAISTGAQTVTWVTECHHRSPTAPGAGRRARQTKQCVWLANFSVASGGCPGVESGQCLAAVNRRGARRRGALHPRVPRPRQRGTAPLPVPPAVLPRRHAEAPPEGGGEVAGPLDDPAGDT